MEVHPNGQLKIYVHQMHYCTAGKTVFGRLYRMYQLAAVIFVRLDATLPWLG